MKKSFIHFIIIFTALSLLGIVTTQTFWVRDALSHKQKDFNQSVRIAMKSVVNRLFDVKNDTVTAHSGSCSPECHFMEDPIIRVIRPYMLDSILKEELKAIKIDISYEYAIFRHKSHKIIMGNNHEYTDKITGSNHIVSLTCLYKPDAYMLGIYFPDERNFLLRRMYIWIGISSLCLIIVVFAFTFTILSLLRQKKLSEMKTDFVNNMTHEFKTPISTISLTSEMLMNPIIAENKGKVLSYAHIIFEENNRLKTEVENVLQVAVIEKGEMKLNKTEINIHEVIEACVSNFSMRIQQREGILSLSLQSKNPVLMADKTHVSNVISNLLDNAEKYSNNKPEISISTADTDNGISISISDKGIGIAREDQKDVFKQFHRVHTGNIHDVKGFGLGLYYVKSIVEAHSGTVQLYSDLRKGCTFEVYFPRN